MPEEIKEECGIDTKQSPDDDEGQQEKYDRLSSNGLRIQVSNFNPTSCLCFLSQYATAYASGGLLVMCQSS